MRKGTSKAVSIASSHVITTCATLAATLLFVGLSSQIVPFTLSGVRIPDSASVLRIALFLNIAIILFGWRRSKDLREALHAYEEAESAARRNANTDSITGLYNRRELMRSLAEALEAKSNGALLLLDLDHFKRVNDLHGHFVGDELLRSVAEVLKRASPDGSCPARMGGDEFVVLLTGTTTSQSEEIATSILSNLCEPVQVENIEVRVSGSIGLAAIDGCDSGETALRRSDVALYQAKGQGRNCVAWFDQQLERELADRVRFEEDLRRGIERGEFVPFFQPLIDLDSRELVGFEALARWESSTRGLIEAEQFIEVAERSGLIGPLSLDVLEKALREARTWPDRLKLAVNVSPVQFRDHTLAEQFAKLLTITGFPAKRLEIEITESSVLENREQALAIITSLKNLGISISLDDFGTGYASLAQIQELPLDRIKIDKSFINTIVKSEQTAAIVTTIANLGHTLEVPITAEGVESERIRDALKGIGCSEAQGWLFGRAISGEAVRAFLDTKDESDMPARFAANQRGFRGPK
ncbi:MAG TPA: EAL domain-containing protein [Sphingomicrobium sp.]|nr:EAL domain-containing protein [Sphingomicrobium sp.]